MKNTTFRKKALLSSVAMLLVALVALGSATFAWFTANTEVTANGLQSTASTADGLKIAKTAVNTAAADAPLDSAYSQSVSIELASAEVWGPVSPIFSAFNATPAMYTGTAKDYTSYKLDGAATATGTTYYATDLWIKATSATTLTVAADITGTAANYARIALVDNQGNVTYLGQSDEWYLLGADGNESTTKKTCDVSATIRCAEIAKGQQFNVYVWFEGQDQQCIDANAGKNLAVNLTFTKA